MITPSLFHDPPTPIRFRLHTVSAGPPEISIFSSFPPESNAMNLLSGDQNNMLPTDSVPGIGRISSEFRARIHMRGMPSALDAIKANWQPSGERASPPVNRKESFAGKGIWSRTGSAGTAFFRPPPHLTANK